MADSSAAVTSGKETELVTPARCANLEKEGTTPARVKQLTAHKMLRRENWMRVSTTLDSAFIVSGSFVEIFLLRSHLYRFLSLKMVLLVILTGRPSMFI